MDVFFTIYGADGIQWLSKLIFTIFLSYVVSGLFLKSTPNPLKLIIASVMAFIIGATLELFAQGITPTRYANSVLSKDIIIAIYFQTSLVTLGIRLFVWQLKKIFSF